MRRLQIALTTAWLVSWGTFANEPDDFVIIDLKCPSSEDTTLSLVSRNPAGLREKIIADFRAGKPAWVEIFASENHEEFVKIFPQTAEDTTLTEEETRNVRENVTEKAQLIFDENCTTRQ